MRLPLFAAAAALLFPLTAAFGHGGPPMITDDPGTPGNGNWEINTALTIERLPGETSFEAPLLDINYGLGERIQLKYEASWLIEDPDDEPSKSGLSNSLAGVKWRFYDGGEKAWQFSTYPQVEFRDPGSHSVRRGLTDGGTGFILPVEGQREFESWTFGFETGFVVNTRTENEWIYGVVFGYALSDALELVAELHATSSDTFSGTEMTFNVGLRYELSERYSLLASVGRDIFNSEGSNVSVAGYVGLQTRL